MAPPDPGDPRPPASLARQIARNGLALAGLSGLAIAQPLLDIYGRNPEALVANDLRGTEILAFCGFLVAGIPLVLVAVEVVAHLISPRIGAAAHAALVTALGALLALAWMRELGWEAAFPVFAIAAAAGAGLALAERRIGGLRSALRILSVASIGFAALFVFGSDASRLLTQQASAAEGTVLFQSRARPPVVWLVLDEFPLSTILDPEGDIDASRFAGFERLSRSSHWFRNSYSPASLTQFAVPMMLSGKRVTADQLPVYGDHPRNLFTILGSEYRIWEYQVFTELCPDDVCDQPSIQHDRPGGLGRALGDALVVYGHQTLPEALRDELPQVDSSWAGFLGEDVSPQRGSPDPATAVTTTQPPSSEPPEPAGSRAYEHWREVGDGRSASNQAAVLGELIDSLDPEADARMWFAHVALPHAPWVLTPLGYQNTVSSPEIKPETMDEERIAFEARQKRQRHLLQAGVVDQLIDRLISRMQELGIWEEALVVVTSDHGVSLLPPDVGRTPSVNNVHEVYRQPMFLKLPGQDAGEVHDDVASTLDLLPSVLDALDIDVGWELDGHSLLDGSSGESTMRVMAGPGKPTHVPPSFSDFLETVVSAHARDFPVPGWLGVAAVGEYGYLVGEQIGALDLEGQYEGSATLDQAEELAGLDLEAGLVPVTVTGDLTLPEGGPASGPARVEQPPEELVLVLNGRVAGIGGGWQHEEGARWHFSAYLAEELFVSGANEVVVLVPSGTPQHPVFTVAG